MMDDEEELYHFETLRDRERLALARERIGISSVSKAEMTRDHWEQNGSAAGRSNRRGARGV